MRANRPSPERACVFFLGFCQLRVFFPEAHDREGDYAELQQRYDNRPRRGYNDIWRAEQEGRCQDKTVYHIQQDHRQDIFTDFHL